MLPPIREECKNTGKLEFIEFRAFMAFQVFRVPLFRAFHLPVPKMEHLIFSLKKSRLNTAAIGGKAAGILDSEKLFIYV
jgi:hypothetical protein